MNDTTVVIPPNGIFLGATETDMIALEWEGRWESDLPPTEMNSG
jgi:hypothetical protein